MINDEDIAASILIIVSFCIIFLIIATLLAVVTFSNWLK